MLTKNNTNRIDSYHLQRLFLFRSSMIVAEVLLLTIAVRLSDSTFPLLQVMLVLAGYAFFHVITWLKRPHTSDISARYFFAQLCMDVLALSMLLYYTGGSNNPFVSLFLLPLLLVAAILPKPYIWAMAALTTLAYALLMVFPFTHHDMASMGHMAMQQSNNMMNTHAIGMAASFLFSVGVILFFVVSMVEALRDKEHKLAEAQEKSLRDEHVVALGTLAAGAAHELGTPLGTMAILTKEMENEYANNKDLVEQISILREQVNRCKTTISQINSSAGQLKAAGGKRMPITTYIEDIAHVWQSQHDHTSLQIDYLDEAAPELVVDDTLQQAIISLLNNSADAGATNIILKIRWDNAWLHLHIIDDGTGLTPDIQSTLGKLFVSSKADGQGLGFYLAQAVVSRMHGSISIQNKPDSSGAQVDIRLPLQHMSIEHE